MSLILKPGTRIFSKISAAEFIVVSASPDPVDVMIGGHDAIATAGERDLTLQIESAHGGDALMGKRYVDVAGTIELLCTKAGAGIPVVQNEPLVIKDAQPLPSSD